MQTIGNHTISFRKDLTFYDFTRLIAIVGNKDVSTVMWEILPFILDSFNDKVGEDAIEELKNLRDVEVFNGIIETMGEALNKLFEWFNEKKKK